MRLKIFLAALMLTVSIFSAYAEEMVLYRSSAGFIPAIFAKTSDGNFFIGQAFFSFEAEVEKWAKDLHAEITRSGLSTALMNYIHDTFFPMHTTASIMEMADERDDLFLDVNSFAAHLENNDLNHARVTTLRIVLTGFARASECDDF